MNLMLSLIVSAMPIAAPPTTPASMRPAHHVVVDATSVTIERVARQLRPEQVLRVEGLQLDPAGAPVDLELRPFRVFAPDARIIVHTATGDLDRPAPDNVYLRGSIDGNPRALAVLTVRENGATRGLVARDGKTWALSTPAGAAGLSAGVLQSPDQPFACGADGLASPQPVPAAAQVQHARTQLVGGGGTGPSYTARIAVETDWEFYQLFGNATDAADYVGDLIGYSSVIYSSEIDTSLVVSHLSLWATAADPWAEESSSVCAILEFGRYWNDNNAGIERTLAHIISGRGLGGGVAWLGVLCSGPFDYDHGGECGDLMPIEDNYGGGYALSGNIGASFDFENPASVWDIIVVAHETGHNFNSPHTHCYGDIGGNPSPIDGCAESSCGNPGCYCGASGLPDGCPGPEMGCGTLMSYCHQLEGGLPNFGLTLGLGHPYGDEPDRVPARMHAAVLDAAAANPGCLDPILECPSDLNGDGNVDALDFLGLIAQWGDPCGGDCSADITGPAGLPDGLVDALDFLLLIEQWGTPANCPGN